MKIFHVADIHLGRKRLESRLPDHDLVAAFRFIAEAAIREKADVLLIAGDLFDRAQVEPSHLRQAQEVLRLLKNEDIPVIAIEGNHDKALVHSSEQTWVQYLADDDLLTLLRPSFNAEGAILEPWNERTRTGAWIDIAGVRFVGAGYLGAATPAKVRQILARLPAGPPIVLLLHAGPDYFVGEGGGFSKDDLHALEQSVCYLALGHIHKPMRHADWACNPGSPENCELREAAAGCDKKGVVVPRGFAVVEIEPAAPEKPVKLEVRSNPRRPVHRVELDCTPFGSKTKNGAEALVAAAVKVIAALKPSADDVIDLWLTGRLNLNRIALDQAVAASEIGRSAGVFAVALDTTHLNVGEGFADANSADAADIPRDELERRAIRDLVEEHPLWGLGEKRQDFAELFYELKEAVRMGRTADEIAGQISTNPLVEFIRAVQMAPPPAQPEGTVANILAEPAP